MVNRDGSCRFRQVYVLDTSSFLAALPLQVYRAELVTTPSVVLEVRDRDSRAKLETSLALGRVRVSKPSPRLVERVKQKALEVGEAGLSSTDIEVLGLALEYREKCPNAEVVLVTDDYSVQNLATHLGIKFKPIRTRGISRERQYIIVCPACGYRAKSLSEKVCPVCGTRLVRRRLRSINT